MDSSVSIKAVRLTASARMPKYTHTGPWGDLAADLYAAAATKLGVGETTAIATGVALEFPSGYGALVEDRSGLAAKGITTLAGVIDPGYRGEIKVVLTNVTHAPIMLNAGDRIAQLRIVRRIQAEFVEVPSLDETQRGAGGFGSTGA